MNISFAKSEDIKYIRNLWEYCFDDSEEFVDWFFQNRYSNNNSIVAYDKVNRLMSALQLLPYNIMLRGKSMQTSYIVGVSTWPEYRNKGCIREMLHYALSYAKSHGQWVSILLPFRYDFYRKFGWEICYDHTMYDLNIDEIKMYEYSSMPIKLIDIEYDMSYLSSCYKSFTSKFNGIILRNPSDWRRYWQDLIIDGGTGYLIDSSNGNYMGYILFTILENKLIIRELVYNNTHAKEALLGFAANYCYDIKTFKWVAPSSDLSYLKMKDPRKGMYRLPFVMGRIIDVQNALNNIIPQHKMLDDNIDIIIKIEDDFFADNNGTFMIKIQNGKLNVYPTDAFPMATISINILSQFLWGYLSPSQAAYNGMYTYNEKQFPKLLDEVFPPKNTLLWEEY